MDGFNTRGVCSEFLAEEREALIERTRGAVVGNAPESIKQVVTREDLSGILRKEF